ncbi:MAG: hypothetical protein K6C12_08265 [Oscillospiraceae bacterium]|nr:hypothetical protein [Oscillospiraceae bacterium]
MSDETAVRLCAPTPAGIRNGNFFPRDCDSRKEPEQEIRVFNRCCVRRRSVRKPCREAGPFEDQPGFSKLTDIADKQGCF